ncbi:MAG: 3-deoxy-manno-octulosonate cytidylyltransferase [Gammaproteobacteria bacterium]|jgi:3-deoxy-manno-octulosonate cytidylyltransferase (CMP-KDO synthetase)|uniref:3-deoxy-manno-octulosonate cytidylyltransferase n=1 Tax=SAR86 cluster bacterium TaxID=2030880 RepID=A0A520MZG0_9GAMM|nr:MAG: 3-deoxy-manno-octulosonate cytidylyltransferase [SAR86 cluster bacterium]|tara:strand:+ start:1004 stop:1762 length:759 start_codon:yes stop_codon:yes gene_type:complete
MRIVIGIPARMGSTRFPGKPLCKIRGLTMLEHCYKRSCLSKAASEIFVAGCDIEIENEVSRFNGKFINTDKNITRPGLRVAEAAKSLGLDDDDIVVVLQGDEPLIRPEMIDSVLEPVASGAVPVSNGCYEASLDDLNDPAEIKVVCDNEMNALYMSRAPIPSQDHEEVRTKFFKQVCVMPFQWGFMKKFNNELKPTSLELQESIEMNRAIQHGFKVRMVETKFKTKSVDNENDRIDAENLMDSDEVFLSGYK